MVYCVIVVFCWYFFVGGVEVVCDVCYLFFWFCLVVNCWMEVVDIFGYCFDSVVFGIDCDENYVYFVGFVF